MTALVQLGDSASARFTIVVFTLQVLTSGNRRLRHFDLKWLVCRFTVPGAGIYRRSGSTLVFTAELVDLAELLDALDHEQCGQGALGSTPSSGNFERDPARCSAWITAVSTKPGSRRSDTPSSIDDAQRSDIDSGLLIKSVS